MKLKVSRAAHFNAAHRLHNPNWSEEKNQAIFGKCNNPNYHGHNYELLVHVIGEVDPDTGFVIDTKILQDIIAREVETYLDHKNLNIEVPEFDTLNPTAEHIAYVIWHRLRPHLSQSLRLEIELYETPRNSVTYYGE